MAYCKKFIILFLILFILFFNFSICFADEVENVDFSIVNNLQINASYNYFANSNSSNVGYFELEKGYIYHIQNTSDINTRQLAVSDDIPVLNGTYTYLGTLEPGSTYNYIANNNDILYFDFFTQYNIKVTREKIIGHDSAISSLVDNVGPNALWGTFGNSIDFIFVVVLFAFGLFIIYKLIRGLNKGKTKI